MIIFQGAIVIHEVYEDGAAAKDGRLWAGDQILEVSNFMVDCWSFSISGQSIWPKLHARCSTPAEKRYATRRNKRFLTCFKENFYTSQRRLEAKKAQ